MTKRLGTTFSYETRLDQKGVRLDEPMVEWTSECHVAIGERERERESLLDARPNMMYIRLDET